MIWWPERPPASAKSRRRTARRGRCRLVRPGLWRNATQPARNSERLCWSLSFGSSGSGECSTGGRRRWARRQLPCAVRRVVCLVPCVRAEGGVTAIVGRYGLHYRNARYGPAHEGELERSAAQDFDNPVSFPQKKKDNPVSKHKNLSFCIKKLAVTTYNPHLRGALVLYGRKSHQKCA